jgi:hypothetical protein
MTDTILAHSLLRRVSAWRTLAADPAGTRATTAGRTGRSAGAR